MSALRSLFRPSPLRLLGLSGRRAFASVVSTSEIPHIYANDPTAPENIQHVQKVDQHLKNSGVLKISLGFDDDECSYLQQLILQLHRDHQHGLPITNTSSRGWLWDARPARDTFDESNTAQIRPKRSKNFPWHTDCSYETSPPRYFALQVLREDQYGGDTLSVLDSARLMYLLSPETRLTLTQPDFRITVPPESIKDENQTQITGSLVWVDDKTGKVHLRFQCDIIEPLTMQAEMAMEELQMLLVSTKIKARVVDLTPEILPRGSIVIMDNRRWLHARKIVRDPSRHLRQVRWDAQPFGEM